MKDPRNSLPNRLMLLVSILVLLTAFNGCGSNNNANNAAAKGGDGKAGKSGNTGNPSAQPPRQVRLITALERDIPQIVIAPGTLAADEQIAFSFKVAGRLGKLNVDLGSPVKKGQIIAELEKTDFQNRVEQAEAALQQARVRLGLSPEINNAPNADRIVIENTALVRQARAVMDEALRNRERAEQLVNSGVQPRAELDRTEAALKVAESRYQDAIEEVRNRQAVLLQRRAELEFARQQLAYTTLRAPSDGSVLSRQASSGEFVAGGSPVVTVVRVHPLRLRVEVPERDAAGIRAGQPVSVSVDADVSRYAGRVVRLSPAIQEQSRTLIIEAEVDNQQGRLRPGMFAKAEVQTSTSSGVVTIPPSAIVTFAGIQKIFLVKDGKAIEKTVVLGRRTDTWVEITEGLQAGEEVIDAPGNLVTGSPVTTDKPMP